MTTFDRFQRPVCVRLAWTESVDNRLFQTFDYDVSLPSTVCTVGRLHASFDWLQKKLVRICTQDVLQQHYKGYSYTWTCMSPLCARYFTRCLYVIMTILPLHVAIVRNICRQRRPPYQRERERGEGVRVRGRERAREGERWREEESDRGRETGGGEEEKVGNETYRISLS